MYRAFDQDVQTNRELLAAQGKLSMPVSVVGGAASIASTALEDMIAEIANDWDCQIVENTGHWISEEQPNQLVEVILGLHARSTRYAKAR